MLIANWREASRWWSMRVSALGSLLFAAMGLMPDQLLTLWNMMPAEIRDHVPSRAASWIGVILFVLVAVTRVLPQKPAGSVLASRSGKVAPKAAGGIAAAIAAAVLIVTPFTAAHEGIRTIPYADIGGKMTVCYGETRVAMRVYSPAECRSLLTKALTSDYAPPVIACVPQLADAPYPFAASIDAAYNAGAGAFCRSPAAARFRLRDWRGGCAALIGWRATVKGVPVRGLANRRRDQMALCLTGLPA